MLSHTINFDDSYSTADLLDTLSESNIENWLYLSMAKIMGHTVYVYLYHIIYHIYIYHMLNANVVELLRNTLINIWPVSSRKIIVHVIKIEDSYLNANVVV